MTSTKGLLLSVAEATGQGQSHVLIGVYVVKVRHFQSITALPTSLLLRRLIFSSSW